MSDWESAKHGHAQFAQLIAQYVDKGPFPSPRFGRANELADGNTLQAFEASGPAKLSEGSIDLPDEDVDRLNEENRPSKTGTGPSDGPCDRTKAAANQEAGCHALNRDQCRSFIAVLMNDLRFRFHQGPAEMKGRVFREKVLILRDMRSMKSSPAAFVPER